MEEVADFRKQSHRYDTSLGTSEHGPDFSFRSISLTGDDHSLPGSDSDDWVGLELGLGPMSPKESLRGQKFPLVSKENLSAVFSGLKRSPENLPGQTSCKCLELDV